MHNSRRLMLGTCLGFLIGAGIGYYRGVENARPLRIIQTDFNKDGRRDIYLHSHILPNALLQNEDGSYTLTNKLDLKSLEELK